MDRIWRYIATSDTVMADASLHIKELQDRQERLEDAAEDARAVLAQRLKVLDDVNAITAYAKEMRDFLDESEPTERRPFIKSFVKEIVVMPGDGLLRYTIPTSDDSRIPGKNAEDNGADGSVLSTVHKWVSFCFPAHRIVPRTSLERPTYAQSLWRIEYGDDTQIPSSAKLLE